MAKLKMKRFPGDTIVVPMLIGVVLNSFIPQVLQIGGFFTGMVEFFRGDRSHGPERLLVLS